MKKTSQFYRDFPESSWSRQKKEESQAPMTYPRYSDSLVAVRIICARFGIPSAIQ